MTSIHNLQQAPELDIGNILFQLGTTKVAMSRIYTNIEKFAYDFVYSLVKDSGECISNESTKMATMFLQLLRASISSSCLQQNLALWIDIGNYINS